MAYPVISINQQNLSQGGTDDVERTALFIGLNDENADSAVTNTVTATMIAIGASTDLDDVLGDEDSDLKAQIDAARDNAGPNFTAWVVPLYSVLGDGETGTPYSNPFNAVEFALEQPNDISPEMIVLTDPVTAADLTDLQSTCTGAINVWSKYTTIHAAVAGIADQTWSEYITAMKAIVGTDVYDRVHLVPQLHGNNLGVVIGRLMSESVSIADSPMRVKTGAVQSLGDAPQDNTGVTLTIDHLKELAGARFSVPFWYNGKDGIYWADHVSLDASDGDFAVYENRRVIDYATRRVRLLTINKVADRSLNASASSIAYHESYFMQPLQDAAKSTTLNGEPTAGMVQTPADGDIAISWPSTTEVQVAMQAAPKNSPKKITVYISLDLTRLES